MSQERARWTDWSTLCDTSDDRGHGELMIEIKIDPFGGRSLYLSPLLYSC